MGWVQFPCLVLEILTGEVIKFPSQNEAEGSADEIIATP